MRIRRTEDSRSIPYGTTEIRSEFTPFSMSVLRVYFDATMHRSARCGSSENVSNTSCGQSSSFLNWPSNSGKNLSPPQRVSTAVLDQSVCAISSAQVKAAPRQQQQAKVDPAAHRNRSPTSAAGPTREE